MASGGAIGLPETILVVADRFDGALDSARVGAALQRGLAASGQPAEVIELPEPHAGALLGGEPGARALLDSVGYDARMRRALAVITGAGMLDRDSLIGTLLSEVATGARQAGVPCHAVVGRDRLSRFELRILDLQMVVEAGMPEEIEAAGAAIGAAIAAQRALGRPRPPPQ